MATILFAWESGGGLGHAMQMLPLAKALLRRGHHVRVALRHLSTATAEVLGDTGVRFHQAPFKSAGPRPFAKTGNFAHVLANTGWGEARELFALAYAWRNLLEDAGADLVVFDHAPTALLASRVLARPVARVLLGSGFCCPPDEEPLPPFHTEPAPDLAGLREDEGRVLARANHVLGHWGRPPLGRLGQLYSDVDENFLTTLPELEQYPGRTGARYWGPVLRAAGGEAPQWPAAEGKRVFAYLKPFAALPVVLGALGEKGCPTLLYVDGLDGKTRQEFESETLRFAAQRVDLAQAARECDLAVLNAGQGSTAQVLLAGKPVLQIPLVLEQELTARAVSRMGAGVVASPKDGADVAAKLEAMLASETHAEAARAFASRYRHFDPAGQVQRMAARLEELLGERERRPQGAAANGAKVAAGVFRA